MDYEVKIELVKVEEKGTHILVDAVVNDKPAKFIVDTGASQTVMDKGGAQTFLGSISVEESETKSKGLGTDSMQSFITILESLQIGDLMIESQEIVLLDLSHVIKSYVEMGLPAIDGVIGGDILVSNKAIIDYGKEVIIFIE